MKEISICPLCGKSKDSLEHIAEQWLLSEIRKEHPDWVEDNGVCSKCVKYYRDLDNVIELNNEQD